MSDDYWLFDGILVFLCTIKYHVFQDPLSAHICWYLYYLPMLLIPTLGLNAALLLEEKENSKIRKNHVLLLVFAAIHYPH